MPGAAARILVAAAVPGLAPGAAGLVRAAAAVRAAVAAAPAQGLLLAPAVDLVARRIRERARRRRRSAATALRRTRIAAGAGAGAAAPRVKRARKRGKRARRGSPGPGLALGLTPGLVLDLVLHLELRISQGNLSQRAARSPRAMTRAASLREAHALVLVLSLLRSPNPEPGLNQSPNPVPPHLPKPAPAPPPDRSPALNPAPSLVLVPVLAPSSDFGLFVTSPPPSVSLLPSIYIPRARQHYPHLLFFDK